MKKIIALMVSLPLFIIPVSASPIESFQVVSNFPEEIYGGESISAVYSFNLLKNMSLALKSDISSNYEFTSDGLEIDGFSMSVNGSVLNCTHNIYDYNYSITCLTVLTSGKYLAEYNLTLATNIFPDDYTINFWLAPFGEYSQNKTYNINNQTVKTYEINNTSNETQTAAIIVGKATVDITINENETYQYAEMPEKGIAIVPKQSGVVIDPSQTFFTEPTKELRVKLDGSGTKDIVIYSPMGKPEKIWFDNKEISFSWDAESLTATFTINLGSPHTIIASWLKPKQNIIYKTISEAGVFYKYRNITHNITQNVTVYINQTIEVPTNDTEYIKDLERKIVDMNRTIIEKEKEINTYRYIWLSIRCLLFVLLLSFLLYIFYCWLDKKLRRGLDE